VQDNVYCRRAVQFLSGQIEESPLKRFGAYFMSELLTKMSSKNYRQNVTIWTKILDLTSLLFCPEYVSFTWTLCTSTAEFYLKID
jgi:hypothetical protein